MTKIYAKDLKCCQCKKKAVCFWPMVDPDIQEHPYCRKCVDKAKLRTLIALTDMNEKTLKHLIKSK